MTSQRTQSADEHVCFSMCGYEEKIFQGLFSFVCRWYVSFFIYLQIHTLLARRRLLIIQTHNKAYKRHLELNVARKEYTKGLKP